MRSIHLYAAMAMLMAFAPQPQPPAPDCGPPGAQQATREYVEGYGRANVAIRQHRLQDAIDQANALEPFAATGRQRSTLSSIRQTAYAGLNDDKAVLAETEKQLDLGCLSAEQVAIQTELASSTRNKLGLPPRN